MQPKSRIRHRGRRRPDRRFRVGHSIKEVGGNGQFAVIDTLSGWIRAFYETREEAQCFADECEAGRIVPPDPRRN